MTRPRGAPGNSHHLNRRQIRKMAVRPDLMVQYAHYLGDLHAKDGVPPIVSVRAVASVNQLERQLLVDPEVDLTTKPRDLWTKDWVIPLTATHEPGSGMRGDDDD